MKPLLICIPYIDTVQQSFGHSRLAMALLGTGNVAVALSSQLF